MTEDEEKIMTLENKLTGQSQEGSLEQNILQPKHIPETMSTATTASCKHVTVKKQLTRHERYSTEV